MVFSFKEAAIETTLPLLGIVLTIYTGKWGLASIPQAASVLKTLWSKLIVLKRPEDADAIAIVNAIVWVRARHVLQGANEHPSNHELEIESGLSRDSLIVALRSLRSRGVIEASPWAAQTDDFTQQGNCWKIKIRSRLCSQKQTILNLARSTTHLDCLSSVFPLKHAKDSNASEKDKNLQATTVRKNHLLDLHMKC